MYIKSSSKKFKRTQKSEAMKFLYLYHFNPPSPKISQNFTTSPLKAYSLFSVVSDFLPPLNKSTFSHPVKVALPPSAAISAQHPAVPLINIIVILGGLNEQTGDTQKL
jgi:hypothetical protein